MKRIISIFILITILFCIISNAVMADTGTINTTTVRMRREPNTSSDILQLIGEGTEVEILGEENGWYRVEYDGVTGYISSTYVDSETHSSTTPETSNSATATPDPDYEIPDNIAVVENTTNDTGSSGETISDDNSEEPSDNETTNDNSVPITSEATEFELAIDVNLRAIPSFSSSSIATISEGTNVTVLDSLNNWVKITDETNTGWVIRQNAEGSNQIGNAEPKENLDEVTTLVSNTTETPAEVVVENSANVVPNSGVVNTDGARLRASADGRIYTLLDINTEIEIIGEESSWYIINYGKYTNAYIAKSLVNAN